MKKTSIKTFHCYFVIGSNRNYDKETHISKKELLKLVKIHQEHTKTKSQAVCVSDCKIVFEDYEEDCYKLEVINYPRFPSREDQIVKYLSELIEYLMLNLDQQRVTLVTPTKSIMFEN